MDVELILLAAAVLLALILLAIVLRLQGRLDAQAGQARQTEDSVRALDRELRDRQITGQQEQQKTVAELERSLLRQFADFRQGVEQRHADTQKTLQDAFRQSVESVQRQVGDHLKGSAEQVSKSIAGLTESTDKRLKEISGQVDKRLAEGFDKTNETFRNIGERLALIDQAQQKITELSTNVVSLQEILRDRTSRGAFGEMQLEGLLSNVLPAASYKMQHLLSNGRRVDCMLFLPAPTGNVPIDSKFPLENYRRKVDPEVAADERAVAEREFVRNVRQHIDDIASRYILPGETAEAAMMFIPAEAVFAEIHARHPDLVELSLRKRVLLASPTTLWAILTTAAAMLKDAETRKQVHIIQDELRKLAKEFKRFEERWDKLANHIQQASRDVDQVSISAKKITSKFDRIERLELEDGDGRLEAGILESPEG